MLVTDGFLFAVECFHSLPRKRLRENETKLIYYTKIKLIELLGLPLPVLVSEIKTQLCTRHRSRSKIEISYTPLKGFTEADCKHSISMIIWCASEDSPADRGQPKNFQKIHCQVNTYEKLLVRPDL